MDFHSALVMLQILLNRLAKNIGHTMGTKNDSTNKANHCSPQVLPIGCLVSMSFRTEPISIPIAVQVAKNSGVVSLFIGCSVVRLLYHT
jgi:hypothetical protein